MPKHVSIRIDQAYRDKLAALATAARRPMSEQLRVLIDAAEKQLVKQGTQRSGD